MATKPARADEWREELQLPDDHGLVARVVRLNMLVTRVLDELTSTAGISPSDYLVLAVLRRSPGHSSSPTRMCDILGRSTGGMTLTIDRLAAAGWLARTQDPDDRRRVVVTLTAGGLDISSRINDELHAWESSLHLTRARRHDIVRIVDDLLDLFERAANGDDALDGREAV